MLTNKNYTDSRRAETHSASRKLTNESAPKASDYEQNMSVDQQADERQQNVASIKKKQENAQTVMTQTQSLSD